MKYNNYDTYDFLKDENFRRWVFEQNERDNLFWKDWLNTNPEIAPKALMAREILTSIDFSQKNEEENTYKEVLKGVFDEKRPQRFQKESKIVFLENFQKDIIRNIAASIILLLMAIGFWHILSEKELDNNNVDDITQLLKKETLKGQKLNLSLMDGSSVKLNAGSLMTFPEHFSDSLRVVELEKGEAFFKIARNERKPFIVSTNDVEIVVLGTSFNVSAYPENDLVSVAVTEGKVSLKVINNTGSLFLTPGEVCYYNRQTGKVQKTTFDPDRLLAWKDGVLLFEDANLEEVVLKLEMWYGIRFKLEGRVTGKRKFNGRFENASLETVLEAFGFSSLFNYELNKNEVILRAIQ